jgi:Mn-dependent DtxR family transcriptional regulator
MLDCKEIAKTLGKSKINTMKLAILLYLGTVGEAKLTEAAKALNTSKSVVWKYAKEMKEEDLVAVSYTLGPHPQMVLKITPKGVEELLQRVELLDAVVRCVRRADE